MVCVYLPDDAHKFQGIYSYHKEYYTKERGKGFVLIRYSIGERSLGSAICYFDGTDFLVDSVEGNRVFRKPGIFERVYEDLIYRAEEKGAKRVVFNRESRNETPQKFIGYISIKEGLNEGIIRMNLDTEGYLEANKEGVNGYYKYI